MQTKLINVVGIVFPSIKIARGYKPISQWLNLSRLVFIANLIYGWRFTLVYLYYLKCVLKHVDNDLPVRLETTVLSERRKCVFMKCVFQNFPGGHAS